MNDRQIADTVNQLRDIAKQYHDTQQLREQIAGVVVPLLKPQYKQVGASWDGMILYVRVQ